MSLVCVYGGPFLDSKRTSKLTGSNGALANRKTFSQNMHRHLHALVKVDETKGVSSDIIVIIETHEVITFPFDSLEIDKINQTSVLLLISRLRDRSPGRRHQLIKLSGKNGRQQYSVVALEAMPVYLPTFQLDSNNCSLVNCMQIAVGRLWSYDNQVAM